MSLRLAILKRGPRTLAWLGLVIASGLVPALVLVLAAWDVMDVRAERDRLQTDLAALSERLTTPVPTRPALTAPVARSLERADQALDRQAETLIDGLRAQNVQILSRGSIRTVQSAGVSERRVLIEAEGPITGFAAPLAALAAEPVGVQYVEIVALPGDRAELTIVLVQVLAPEAI